MWRAAVVLGFVACWSSKPSDPTIGNHALVAERDLTAAYFCSIRDGGYEYPPYPCAVRKVEGRWILAKLGGSQRFRGEIKPRGEGFSFSGEFYCPWGDCTQPLHGEFRAVGNGVLRGSFRDAGLIVTLKAAPDSAFGGAGYGGDGYGGFGYGGFGDGGNRRP